MKMYFYRISAGGYEESYQTIYMSSDKYSQEEFEDIVIEIYKKACEKYIEEEERNVCFALDFKVNNRIWDFENNFNKLMEETYGFVSLGKKLTAHTGFDLTHYGRDDEMNQRARKALDEIDIDESCWDNNCSRLPEEDEIPWYRSVVSFIKEKNPELKVEVVITVI